eukprot:Amastigsp_a508481_1324.p2 type:complete len:401 gc:universal Amastigsp_a508481_1324:35-1237(+)
MARSTSFVLLAIVLCNYLQSVAGHGWMVSPQPRSGGGTGSGNASTTGPCGGGAGVTTVTATWTIGQTVSASYMRANAHGATANNVYLTLAVPANLNTPTATDFTDPNRRVVVANGATMDVTIATPQSTSFTVPNTGPFNPANWTTEGTAVLQFNWQPTSGGNWYDCAYITVVPANGVTSCTGVTCRGNSTCFPLPNNQHECRCDPGYSLNTAADTCDPLPPAVLVVIRIKGSTISQDLFTLQIARVLGIPSSRILYDRAVYLGSLGVTDVYFSITADSTGTSGMVKAEELATKVRNGDASVAKSGDFDYTVVSVQVEDQAQISFGQGPAATPSSDSKASAGKTAGIVLGAIIGAAVVGALIVVAVIFVIKKKAGGSSKSKLPHYPTKNVEYNNGAPAPYA